jgi:glycerol-3-phosphate acyltransferase PlsY
MSDRLVFFLFIGAYFVGNLSPGWLLVRLFGRGDVRTQGSGGTGATNTARALGKGWFYAVLALDMLKAAFAVWLPTLLAAIGAVAPLPADAFPVFAVCGVGVIMGHIWPVFLGFRGGKGVGPFIGVWCALGFVAWPQYWAVPFTLLAPIVIGFFFLPFKKGAFMSALCGLFTQPLTLWVFTRNAPATALAVAIVVCILIAHRSNFKIAFGKQPTSLA